MCVLRGASAPPSVGSWFKAWPCRQLPVGAPSSLGLRGHLGTQAHCHLARQQTPGRLRTAVPSRKPQSSGKGSQPHLRAFPSTAPRAEKG